MNMREALSSDDCDKMNHFFGWLLTIDNEKSTGHKLDITSAIREYRKTYGQPHTSEKQINSLRIRTWRTEERDKHAAALEKYKAFPMGVVARICGVSESKVQNWYKVLGISRPINYKGRRF